MKRLLLLVTLVVLMACGSVAVTQAQTSTDSPTGDDTAKDTTSRIFQLVLPGEHLLGDWGGLRSKLEESGITPRWFFITDVAGNPRGGLSQGATQVSSTELSLFFDLDRIFDVKGGSDYKVGRWYDHSALADFLSGKNKVGSSVFYGLFDQVLLPFGTRGSNRGFGVFGSATVAPESRVQPLPLYFTAGCRPGECSMRAREKSFRLASQSGISATPSASPAEWTAGPSRRRFAGS